MKKTNEILLHPISVILYSVIPAIGFYYLLFKYITMEIIKQNFGLIVGCIIWLLCMSIFFIVIYQRNQRKLFEKKINSLYLLTKENQAYLFKRILESLDISKSENIKLGNGMNELVIAVVNHINTKTKSPLPKIQIEYGIDNRLENLRQEYETLRTKINDEYENIIKT